MDIGIISYLKRYGWNDRWNPRNENLLIEAAKKRGHTCRVYRVDKIHYGFDKGLSLQYNGQKFPKLDLVIPRVNTFKKNLQLEMSVLRQMELMGWSMFNSVDSILIAKNKLATYQALSKANLPVPKTIVINHSNYIHNSAKKLGGCPLILKTPIGSFGAGVLLVETEKTLDSSYSLMCRSYDTKQILIQEFLGDRMGIDHRGFVVGGRVVAAMERKSHVVDFRSNLHRGGEAKVINLDKEQERVCVEAAKALDLDIAAVDLLYSKKKGWIITEVNASPGLEGITDATSLDVAGEIVDYLSSKILKVK